MLAVLKIIYKRQIGLSDPQNIILYSSAKIIQILRRIDIGFRILL